MRDAGLLLVVTSCLAMAAPVAWAQEPAEPLDPDEEVFEEATIDELAEGLLDDDDLLFDDGLDELLGGGDLDPGEADGPDSLTDWKGFIALEPRIYLDDRGRAPNDEQLLLEAELELDFRFRDDLTGYFRPRVFLDLLDGDLKRFEPYEAYLTYAGDGWDLRAGQFVENWGIVDTFNPIDVVNRRDLATDFLDPDRLGELGFRYRRFLTGGDTLGEPTVSLYALPVWRATEFPTEDQRFAFDSPPAAFDERAGFEPSGSERGFYAARFNGTVDSKPANADVQFLVSRGPERTPTILVNGAGDLIPAYFGATTLGVGFRAVPNEDVAGRFLSTLTLKAEVVHKSPYEFDGSPIAEPDDYLAYVVGVDRELYDVVKDQDSLTLTVEYAGEEGADDPSGRLRPFRNDLIFRAFWQANDFARSTLEARGIRDLDTHETIFELIHERQLRAVHEDLKLTLAVQLFDRAGDGTSLFDFFPDNSSVQLGLRWDF